MLASVIAWVLALALTLGFLGGVFWMLREVLRNSVGKPRRRALTLSAVAFGLFVLWSASQVVP
jgi:hypothetical protein